MRAEYHWKASSDADGMTDVRKKTELTGFYRAPSSLDLWWWDGYSGQDAVVFDDFDGSLPVDFVLRVLSGEFVELPTRVGVVFANWTKVYFVGMADPSSLYAHAAPHSVKAFRDSLTVTRVTAERQRQRRPFGST